MNGALRAGRAGLGPDHNARAGSWTASHMRVSSRCGGPGSSLGGALGVSCEWEARSVIHPEMGPSEACQEGFASASSNQA